MLRISVLVKFDDARYLGVMDPRQVKVGGEYIWRPESGQTLRVIVTEPSKQVRTSVAPNDVVWQCKVQLPDSPLSRPDSTAFVSDLHEE